MGAGIQEILQDPARVSSTTGFSIGMDGTLSGRGRGEGREAGVGSLCLVIYLLFVCCSV